MKNLKLNFLKFFGKNTDGQTNANKLGLTQLVWLGFNYTCSVGFAYTLSSTYGGDPSSTVPGVGLHLLWIILLGAIIAGGAGWAFAKCARVYSDENGGAFEYTKRTFGLLPGWMIGFYQYILIPVTTPASILVFITVALEGVYNPQVWGPNTEMYLNLIAIASYVLLSLLVLFGTATFKWGTNVASILKWMVLLLVYIGAIITIARTNGANYNHATSEGTLNPVSFNNAFSTFFYAYTGFETFAVIGKNVKNPKKNMPKAIMLVLLCAVIFYIVGLIFIIGALSGVMPANPNNAIIEVSMGSGALIAVVISNIASNVNGFMQGAYYSGGMLQPLSDNYLITNKIAKLNKSGLAVRALVVNLVLTVLFSILWLVLPYILHDKTFNYANLVGFNAVVMFIVYGTVICAAIFLKFKRKVKASIYEVILWFAVILFLIYQFIMYFVQWNDNKWQILTFVVVTILALIWYFAYIVPKYKKLKANKMLIITTWKDLPNWSENENEELSIKKKNKVTNFSNKKITKKIVKNK